MQRQSLTTLHNDYTLKTLPSIFITEHDVICHGTSLQSVGISCCFLPAPSLLCLSLFDLKSEFSSFLLFGTVPSETETGNAVLILLQLHNRFSQINHYSHGCTYVSKVKRIQTFLLGREDTMGQLGHPAKNCYIIVMLGDKFNSTKCIMVLLLA